MSQTLRPHLQLHLLNIKTNTHEVKRSLQINFFGVSLHKKLTDHITIVKSTVKNNGNNLERNKLKQKSLYFSFIHSYINQENRALCLTSIARLTKIASNQKQSLWSIPINTLESELKFRQIMKEIRTLIVYQFNIFNVINVIIMLAITQYLKLLIQILSFLFS